MRELAASFLTVFVGLFPIVNPLCMAPIFLRLTSDATERTRTRLAWQVAIGGFVLMAVSLFIGSHILAFFGLTITAVQIAGGLVVMTAGWRMLQQGNDARAREQQSTASEDTIMRRAFFPHTMPLTIGSVGPACRGLGGQVSIALRGLLSLHLWRVSCQRRPEKPLTAFSCTCLQQKRWRLTMSDLQSALPANQRLSDTC